MEQKIITSKSANDLNAKIKEMIEEGWEPIGEHKVVEKFHQCQYAGTQHMRTIIELEYSQTMRKE